VTLPRRVPLKRGGPLPRSSLPLRRGPLSRTPASRTSEETSARRGLRGRSGGRCEGCPCAAATDYAHRKACSQGGGWCLSNALHLCRACHAWAHANPEMARSVGWMVRRSEDPAAIPALLHGGRWMLLHPDGTSTPIEGRAA
jgi:hypothetical protein